MRATSVPSMPISRSTPKAPCASQKTAAASPSETPPNPKADGKFRQISVKVKRPGLTVRARRGYFAPDASNAAAAPVTAELDPEVRRALDSPRDMADLPVRATALVFDRTADDTARVVVAADVDVKSFLFEPEEGGRSTT